MEKILREVLSKDKSLLGRRDELIAALEKKVPNSKSRDFNPIKRAISLNVGEKFFVGDSNREATENDVRAVLKSSGMQEARINFVVETFLKALDWDKPPEQVEPPKTKPSPSTSSQPSTADENLNEKFCEQCGASLKSNENFCPNCGAKVIREKPSSTTEAKPSPTPQKTTTEIFAEAKRNASAKTQQSVADFYAKKAAAAQKSSSPKPTPSPSTQPPPVKSTPVESTSQPDAKSNMKKFLALIGILVFICAVVLHSGKQSDEALGESLDGLYIGMSKDEVDRKLGAGRRHRGIYIYDNEKFQVIFDSNNKAEYISCHNETVNTKKGVHIGSTIDEVKRAYGNNYQFDDDYPILAQYIYMLGDSILVFLVDKGTNHVDSITLKTTEETSLGSFHLGMIKAEADLGVAGTPDDGGYSYLNGNYWLKFDSDNKANMIICWDETFRTKRGLRVGSTLDEVKNAYGNNYQLDDTTFKENPAYIYTIGKSRLFFFIDKATNRVVALRVETY